MILHYVVTIAFMIFLNYIMTPGVLFTIPTHGTVRTKALVHATLFALLFQFIDHFILKNQTPNLLDP
jgi:hypothetical protein